MEEPISPETKPLNTVLIILESIKITITNLKILLPITLLTILPFSVLLFSLSLESQPLRAHITAKGALYTLAPTAFEARQVRKELIGDYLDLLKLNSLYFLPSYSFSLLATITTVSTAAGKSSSSSTTYLTALSAVRRTWRGALVTSLYVFFLRSAYDQFARVGCGILAVARAKWVFVFCPVLEGFEFYLAAVLNLAMVVSVLEERYGLEALGGSWELIAGKRFSGWVLSGFQVLLSGGIGSALSAVVCERNVVTWSCLLDSSALVCCFCLLVLLSYVERCPQPVFLKKTFHGNLKEPIREESITRTPKGSKLFLHAIKELLTGSSKAGSWQWSSENIDSQPLVRSTQRVIQSQFHERLVENRPQKRPINEETRNRSLVRSNIFNVWIRL